MTFQVGDRVFVIKGNGAFGGYLTGRLPSPAVVTKVARKYCTVELEGPYKLPSDYDKETGEGRDSGGHTNYDRIMTPKAYEDSQRRKQQVEDLYRAGVEIRRSIMRNEDVNAIWNIVLGPET